MPRRCCSRRRSASNRSTPRWRARRTSRRSAPAIFAGRLGSDPGVVEMAEAARAAPPGAATATGGRPAPRRPGRAASPRATSPAVHPLRRALEAVQQEEDIRWLWLACRIASELWDDETWEELATRQVRIARETGALAVLPAGAHATARARTCTPASSPPPSALIEEVGRAQPSRSAARRSCTPGSSWRPGAARRTAAVELPRRSPCPNAAERGEGRALTWGEYAMRPALQRPRRVRGRAGARPRRRAEHDDLGLVGVGADRAGRGGRPQRPARHRRRTPSGASPSGRRPAAPTGRSGIEARSRALRQRRARPPTPSTARRRAARAHPRHRAPRPRPPGLRRVAPSRAAPHGRAPSTCGRPTRCSAASGPTAFAERARRELLATGETVRKRTVEAPGRPHPAGGAGRPAGGRGPHQPRDRRPAVHQPPHRGVPPDKVFTKLDISSRRQLRGALDQLERATA